MVGILYVLHQTEIALAADIGQQGVAGNVVGTFGKQGLSVHHKVEGFAVLVVFHHHFHLAQTNAF